MKDAKRVLELEDILRQFISAVEIGQDKITVEWNVYKEAKEKLQEVA